jgi:reductive dehalogenase
MKALGLTGVGATAIAGAMPVFHDLDEVVSSSGLVKQPWWVKTVDEPTVEVDWNAIQRFDQTGQGYISSPDFTQHYQNIVNDIRNNVPGNTLRDHALFVGSEWAMFGWPSETVQSFVTHPNVSGAAYVQDKDTAIELGLPKWQGTPEENLKTLRAAISWYGGADGGAVELTDRNRKLILAADYYGKPYVFENVDEAYETDTKRVIPDKCRWVISFHILQDGAIGKAALRSELSYSAVYMAYCHADLVIRRVQEFLHVLGYQGIGKNPGAIIGFANLAGLGEMGRHMIEISPYHGSLIREPAMLITDLPLSPTKPIDFGARSFCPTCGKCAKMCPGGAIPEDKEPSWEVAGAWNLSGVKTWFNDRSKCQPYGWKYADAGGCANCQVVCPFSCLGKASIHDVVKATVSNTSIFNGFFYQMDDFFGYGGEENKAEEWWDRDLSTYPYDTTLGR